MLSVQNTSRIADCHAHVIDPVRFPFIGTRGYKPRPDEHGTREEYCAVLHAHGVAHGVLVQLSGYGTNNGAILDAVRACPGRFKAIAVIDPMADDRTLEHLAAAGVVGVRFNLVSYDPDALVRPDAPRLLERLKALGWFAQVFASDAQWPAAARVLKASGVRVLIDHFGVGNPAGGIAQKGFRAVLDLGRAGVATVKLSSPFRVSRMLSGFESLDPFVAELLAAFSVQACLWGSDWPFINVPQRPTYADVMAPLMRWFPDADDRECVLTRNPQRLFGFGD
jgi:predicted TIM-barrel fold metal-dependent hydrolase